jgi:hypothetical protein
MVSKTDSSESGMSGYRIAFWVLFVLIIGLFLLMIAASIWTWLTPITASESLFRFKGLATVKVDSADLTADVLVSMHNKKVSPDFATVLALVTATVATSALTLRDQAAAVSQALSTAYKPHGVSVQIIVPDTINAVSMSAVTHTRGVVTRPLRYDAKEF